MNGNMQTDSKLQAKWQGVRIVNGGFFMLMVGLVIAVYLTPLGDWLADGQLIKATLAQFGSAAPLVYTLATALLVAAGVPRLVLCSLGGMAFGFAWGLIWSQIGSLLGSYVIFLFIRWRGIHFTLHHFPRLRGFSERLENKGLLSVLVLRQLPLNGFYNNILLGLTPASHGDFLLGSLLGFLPLGIPACLLGAGLIQGNWIKAMQYISFGFACSVILGLLLNRQLSRFSSKRDYDPN